MTQVELPNMELTRTLYCYIVRYVAANGHAPTQREMAEACYVSNGTISRHLDRLAMYGWIVRTAGRHRAVVLQNPAPFACFDGDDCAETAPHSSSTANTSIKGVAHVHTDPTAR